MDDASIDRDLNDTTIRLVFIPFFGLIIPNVTGLIDNGRFSAEELLFSYLYFTFIAYAIWDGNRYLLFRLRPRFSWLNQPVHKVVALVISNFFYTIPVSIGLMTLWYAFTGVPADWNVLFKATALCVVCVVFITHTYETVYLIRSWETDKIKSERLERTSAEAELSALKSQLDPHFMFNSLNTLSHLIDEDPAKARIFNDHLADVYRYLLANRDRSLVLLRDEKDFLDDYLALLRIRFGNAIILRWEIPDTALDDIVLPPISLQVLAENAVKHNTFTEDQPMTIGMSLENDAIIVRNECRPKTYRSPSQKVGLKNLGERSRLLTGRDVRCDVGRNHFVVSLPILRSPA